MLKSPPEETRPQPPESAKQQSPKPEITRWLRRWQHGDPEARDLLFQATYQELQQMARRLLYAYRHSEAMHTGTLVHELFLHLAGADKLQELRAETRAAFFTYAATTMRHLIIDSLRRRQRNKRGGGAEHLPLEEAAFVSESRCRELIALDDSLSDLARVMPEHANIIELHYFGGLTTEEMCEVLTISAATVKRRHRHAKSWLLRQLNKREGGGNEPTAH
ncbi:MAG: ECF-type sigma factor [Acidobacteriota bacterium]